MKYLSVISASVLGTPFTRIIQAKEIKRFQELPELKLPFQVFHISRIILLVLVCSLKSDLFE